MPCLGPNTPVSPAVVSSPDQPSRPPVTATTHAPTSSPPLSEETSTKKDNGPLPSRPVRPHSSSESHPADSLADLQTPEQPSSPLSPAKKHLRTSTPQLSERDSIFATHYLAADSGANTPNLPAHGRSAKGDVGNQDVAGGIALPGPVSSRARIASSLPSARPSSPRKMHMAPESAPYSSSSPAPPLSRDGASKQPVDDTVHTSGPHDAETDQEDWDKANEKERSRPNGRRHRSDEQIQATLANAEPIGHARSRKASHYLGLFRENAKEQKQRKSRDRERDVHGVIHDQEQEDLTELDDGQRIGEIELKEEQWGVDPEVGATTQADVTRPRFTSAWSEDAVLSPDGESAGVSPQKPDESVEWFSVEAPSGAYPIRLLEEIRDHPVARRHIREKRKESSPAVSSDKVRAHAIRPLKSTQSSEADDRPLTLPPDHEGEDSDKEHISAATYFPHQAPSPDDIQGQERSGEAYDDLGDPAISPRTTPTSAPQPDRAIEKLELDSRIPDTVQEHQKVSDQAGDISLPGAPPRRVNTGLTEASDTDYEWIEDETDEVDELADVDHTPNATPRVHPTRITKKVRRPRSPLGAVELKPYKHQVGGHTKVFSFSKQAICKELNNKENQFYEVIERRHPELLEFMPRYLGVLNVTYTKAKRKQQPPADKQSGGEDAVEANGGSVEQNGAQTDAEPQERIISHSKNFSAHDETIPRVIYANNMHIIPSNLFPTLPNLNGSVRPSTSSGVVNHPGAGGSHKLLDEGHVESRDSRQSSVPVRSPITDFPSWGATTVNLKLKERVLRDVFSPPVVYAKHNRRVRKPLTSDSFQDPKLSRSESQRQSRTANRDELLSAALLKTASDLTPVSSNEDAYRGGSAPTHHSSFTDLRDRTSVDSNASEPPGPSERHISRRRSDQGLQRLQCDIDSAQRSKLNYYEDEELPADKLDEIFAMDIPNGHQSNATPTLTPENRSKSAPLNVVPSDGKDENGDISVPNSQRIRQGIHEQLQMLPPSPMPIPVNPLQAQQHTDERVRHFLLLEDLTANMVKPCVLDLKMGTRQYGIEANQKKRTSQRMKCKMTTSRQLGVRLCGMQVWNVKKQEYAFEDKYAGRDLRAGREFQAALRRFLFDGVSPASVTRHIPVLLDKLSRLEHIVSQLPRYRFYASSLLLFYDGADLPSQKHVERGAQNDTTPSATPDQAVQESADKTQASYFAGKGQPAASTIDIRLVDFANCVTSQTKRLADAPSPPHHPNQPDRGYIKGLKSLRSYLQRIWMEINTEEAGSWVERGEGEAMAIAQKGAGNADQPEAWRKAGDTGQDEGEVSE